MNQYDKLQKENEELRKACAEHKAANLQAQEKIKSLENEVGAHIGNTIAVKRMLEKQEGVVEGLKEALRIVTDAPTTHTMKISAFPK